MRPARDSKNQRKAERFLVAWGNGVRWLRIGLCALFVPIMLFGAIVAEGARLVPILALPILILIIRHDLRSLRAEFSSGAASSQSTSASAPSPRILGLEVPLDPNEFARQFRGTWRIAVSAMLVQTAAGLLGLQIKIFPEPFVAFWASAALASLPGFLLGLGWHKIAVGTLIAYKPMVKIYALSAALLTVLAWPVALMQTSVGVSAA